MASAGHYAREQLVAADWRREGYGEGASSQAPREHSDLAVGWPVREGVLFPPAPKLRRAGTRESIGFTRSAKRVRRLPRVFLVSLGALFAARQGRDGFLDISNWPN